MLRVAFGECIMSRTQVQFWFNWFKESQKDVNDDAHPCRLNTSTTDENIEAMKKIILDNRWIAIKKVADDVGISFGFMDVLGMKHAAVKIVTKLLNFKQQQGRMDIAQKMLRTYKDDPDMLQKVITFDESTQSTFQIFLPI